MKSGELAKAAGVSKDTVRYYVEKGLLIPSRDPHNGYQVFNPAMLQRLRFIKDAQGLGFKLEEVQQIFADAERDESPCPRVRAIMEQRLAETREHIRELTQLCQQMESAMAAWRQLPDQTPTGHSICQLIESQAPR